VLPSIRRTYRGWGKEDNADRDATDKDATCAQFSQTSIPPRVWSLSEEGLDGVRSTKGVGQPRGRWCSGFTHPQDLGAAGPAVRRLEGNQIRGPSSNSSPISKDARTVFPGHAAR